jgi:hypothetical protein
MTDRPKTGTDPQFVSKGDAHPGVVKLQAALRDCAQQMRDNYRCEGPTWVLNPWEYDIVAKAVQEGTASPEVVRMFADCVRAEAA